MKASALLMWEAFLVITLLINKYMQEQLNYISEHCITNGFTIAVAESVTAGYLQVYLSRATGATQFFQGGITAYNIGQKVKHLQVEPIHAQSHNAVSPQVAVQMAMGVCALFNCNTGIAVTGYAAPVPEAGILNLFAYYAIICKGQVIAARKITPAAKEPEEAMQEYAQQIIHDCYLCFKANKDIKVNDLLIKK
jgi:nicotinamide-nucleotide amidase